VKTSASKEDMIAEGGVGIFGEVLRNGVAYRCDKSIVLQCVIP
jgi:hypothetical protein